MRVARQIGEHRLRPCERALGVDEPARPLERRQIGGERLGADERRVRAVEPQLAGGVCCHELVDHQPPEQLREHAHGQEEVRPLGERRRAAAPDRAHHLELAEADVAAVGVTPSGPVVAEDIRDLQGWATHEGPALCRGLLPGAPPPSTASGARTGFSPRAARWWRRGHSGRWCPTSHGPTTPESPARRYRPPADAWRTSAAAYAA